ncbi:MAG: type II toxin-antitoxin system RelE/ParE family toxin [Ignavibacteria bacterium]|nr:type II toxin-antitoxin system RelE/ParE family toxin [Ignavibacteria bacterium]
MKKEIAAFNMTLGFQKKTQKTPKQELQLAEKFILIDTN